MKRALLSMAMLCALSGMVVVAADKPADKKPDTATTKPTTQPAKPINQFCAVDKDNPVDPTVATVTYKGKVIGFCCEDCAPKFLKDPEYYMKGLK
jgi:YHS domain-containing protein